MSNLSATGFGAENTQVVNEFNATGVLCAPFEVFLYDSVFQVLGPNNTVLETVIPDPDGLVRAVAFLRVLHPQKLDGDDLKFLRSALGLKAVELAKRLGCSAEHLSRLESGVKVLQPQSEQHVRTLTVVMANSATKAKDLTLAEFSEQLIGLFDSIKPCRSIDEEPLKIELSRVPCSEFDLDSKGLWDRPIKVA